MCGIVAGFSKKGKRISKSVMKRYLDQKHRGSQGFGYVAFYKDGKGGKISIGRSTEEPEIRTQIMNEHSSMIMFHHRFPTSTPNVVEATHPIFVSHDELDYDYFVVHNGVIRNATELRTKHEALKYVYNTVIETELVTHHTSKKTGAKYFTAGTKTEKFNDSEALAIEVARVLDGMSSSIDTVGTVATIAWKINKETGKLVSISYGHNSGNPLTITNNNDAFFLTSVGGTDIPEDILHTLSTDGDSFGVTTKREIAVGYDTEYAKARGSNKYIFSHTPVTPRLHAPKVDGVNAKTCRDGSYIRGGKMYKDYNEYYEERFGLNRSVRDNDDKHAEKLDKFMSESRVGFTTEGNERELRESVDGSELSEDEYRIDTSLDNTGEFFMKTSDKMVKQYLELEDTQIDIESDIDTAEMLLLNNADKNSINILRADIKENEEKLEVIQGRMNDVEDKYTELFPSRPSFRTLLDAHVEQSEDDGILYDIQMEDDKRQYELSKHF